MAVQIQLRGGTLAEWTSANPVIAAREMVLETDTDKFKIGNGVDNYLDLPYGGLVGPQGETGATGPQGEQGFDIYVSDTAPTSGETTWFDSTSGTVYVKYDGAWVAVSGPSGPVGPKGDTGDTGSTGAQGASGVVSVTAPITNSGTSSSAVIGFDNTMFTNVAGKNLIINGGFDVWQRGETFTGFASWSYFSDRWLSGFNGSGSTRTVSRQTHTPGVVSVLGQESISFLRYNQSVAGTGGTFNLLQTKIEDVRTAAGQTVTLSFWAKAASNITLPKLSIDQSFGTGGSSLASFDIASNISITTSWQRFVYTFSMPSVLGKTIGINSNTALNFNLPLNSTFVLDLDEVKLEVGSVATPFARAGGTLQGELAACQRYYWRTPPNIRAGVGFGYSTNRIRFMMTHPVTMRSAPSFSSNLSNFIWYDGTTGASVTAVVADRLNTYNAEFTLTTTGINAGRAYGLSFDGTTGFFEFNAEV